MAEEFYRVRSEKQPEQNGFVVRLKDGELELFVGESDISKVGCKINDEGKITAKQGHFLTSISRTKAYKMKKDEFYWDMTRLEYSPRVDASAIPGSPEWAAGR